MNPTDEQLHAVDRARRSLDSLMLSAYAGCAKSTTIELMAREIKTPGLALAFNKKIATELRPRLPANFEVKTLNGLGFGAWTRANPHVTKWTIDDRKIGKLITAIARESKTPLLQTQWGDVKDLVASAQLAGLSPVESGGTPILEDTPESWQSLATWLPDDEVEFISGFAREVLLRSIDLAKSGILSFDDQIYLPLIFGGKWPQFPVVAVDESQDLSPMNHRQLGCVLRPAGRLIAVGDSRQAIYGFRGADANSMTNLRRLGHKWIDLPLTMTFRCPKRIVARQQTHAPGYRAFESNAEGLVENWTLPAKSWGPGELCGLRDVANGELAILCRNVAPIMSLAFKLIRAGVGCQVIGRDIGKGLKNLITKLGLDLSSVSISKAILEWQDREVDLAKATGKDSKLDSIYDRAESVLAILESSSARDGHEALLVVDDLFSRNAGITLSTVHRAKGLEWNSVLILDPWRMPSRLAKTEVELEQEANLIYVAETRTRHTLVLANLRDWRRAE